MAVNSKCKKVVLLVCVLAGCFSSSSLYANSWTQVWADEFDGPEIDRSKWSFDFGPSNDNVHYYTDRQENARIEDGILRIEALKESYKGFNYTASLLKTRDVVDWRYGRIESRIKLPRSRGFVPAFWMMPANDLYGWWPLSGEIDIMEHPTNQVNRIYGTVHTGVYNAFTGSSPRGSNIRVYDAETSFHIYAIEWSEDKIDFFVDHVKYFTFYNDHTDLLTWPFDQSFYLILNVAVGGGWVGTPDFTSVFPATMEVDYVRVFQDINDVGIQGPDYLPSHSQASLYGLPYIDGAAYTWSVPESARIVSGENTPQITVDWGLSGGTIEAEIQTDANAYTLTYPVEVSSNLLKNAGFEKGVKYWNKIVNYPGAAAFSLDTNDVHEGQYSLQAHVTVPGNNGWDIQISQRGLFIEQGKRYTASFWAKNDHTNSQINAAIMNVDDFSLQAIDTFTLTNTWTKYALFFTASSEADVAFNIDMGSYSSDTHFDEFLFSTPELSNPGQLQNHDFSDGDRGWNFNVFDQARATGTIVNGEYAIAITHGGSYPWDIHLGQSDVRIENEKEYTISFDAYAVQPRDITLIVGKNSDPWTVYNGNQAISLTTTKKTYVSSFTMSHPTDNRARLGFDVGLSSTDVYFDNVVLHEPLSPVIDTPKNPR